MLVSAMSTNDLFQSAAEDEQMGAEVQDKPVDVPNARPSQCQQFFVRKER